MESEPTTELAAPEPAAPAEPTPRLMIKSMILENFKSYAGPQEIGPFDKNMSSVVGPNGSGKSNVIDAMLFVFGKRAKKLRLNKASSSALVRSSSFGRRRRTRARALSPAGFGAHSLLREVPGPRLGARVRALC